MIAIVLSGAGSRGPLQVGALQALMEAEVAPDFWVGTSAGAINAVYVASKGFSQATLDDMHVRWRGVNRGVVYPGNLFTAAWRFIRKRNSLYASKGMRRLIRKGLPTGVETFGQLQQPLYVTAVDIISGRLFLFGETPTAPLVDAVLASASIPGIHPPVEYHGLQLVDGGVLANAAASVAMEKGAHEVWVLNAGYSGDPQPRAEGVVEVLYNTLTVMLGQSLIEDLARAQAETAIDLHHVVLRPEMETSLQDFSQADSLRQAGYAAANAYLAAPQPHTIAPHTPRRPDLGQVAPGVREFYPHYWLR